MKMLIKLSFIAFLSIGLATTASAENKDTNMAHSKGKWVCETNASGAANDADKKADENMKKANSGKSAFDYALKHCRDCTKITCTLENN